MLVSPLAEWGQDFGAVCDCGQPACNRVVFWQGSRRVAVGWTCAKHTPSASRFARLIA